MLISNLKIAWRNMLRNKVASVINITGLAIGMASVILIVFYVQDELSYDRFFKNADRIYQINMAGVDNGNDFLTGNTAPAVGPAMVKEFPEIETYARIYRPPGDMVVRYEGDGDAQTYFTERRLLAVDSHFLQVFTYDMKEGNPASCLQTPNSVVITEQTAKRYFGNSPAIGKVVLLGNERTAYAVTGVLHNVPSQSSFQFDLLVPIAAYPEVKRRSWNWSWLQVSTYVKLRSNTGVAKEDIQRLEAKFPAMVKQHAFTRNPTTYEEFVKKGGKMDYQLQPFASVHLYAAGMGTTSRLTTLGDIKYVRIFSIIAVFIIILACVNFMNLSTAQSAKRAKEVGIRKVLGSVKAQLVKQYLTEAMLYSCLATIIALLLVVLLLNPFNALTGKSLSFQLFFSGSAWAFVLSLLLITGLLAGSYPAFYLTAFKPVAVLRGLKIYGAYLGNNIIRNGSVVFQFTVSIALIICTIIVFKQLQFTQNKNLGLTKESVIVIANSNRLGQQEESFRQEITRLPGIINASVSSSIPTRVNFGDVYVPEAAGGDKPLTKEIGLSSFLVDDHFIPTLKIDVLKGRAFSNDFTDSASVILNEAAAKEIGWKDPVGKNLDYPGNSQTFKVIGVVKDFTIESLYTTVAPFALFHTSSKTYNLGNSYISVRVEPGNAGDKISNLQNKWKTVAPNTPFDYSFLDGEFDALYRSEKRMGTVFGIFTVLSIFVACLGLFGLAAYTAERRTKEIGVRRVLGASVHGLVALLSKDFIKLVLLAAVIAFPIAWWGMSKWLQDFAYRITIGWWVFFVAGIMALLIALLTVSFQAIKAAVANPVKSLRTE